MDPAALKTAAYHARRAADYLDEAARERAPLRGAYVEAAQDELSSLHSVLVRA